MLCYIWPGLGLLRPAFALTSTAVISPVVTILAVVILFVTFSVAIVAAWTTFRLLINIVYRAVLGSGYRCVVAVKGLTARELSAVLAFEIVRQTVIAGVKMPERRRIKVI